LLGEVDDIGIDESLSIESPDEVEVAVRRLVVFVDDDIWR